MASVNVLNISVLDNPTAFTNPFQFEVTFECVAELSDDLEWKVVYVGSAESDKFDQELDNVLVGPVPVGVNKFVMQTAPPDPSRIPKTDVLGVTVVLITCSYKSQEFIRVGYYVNNEWGEELAEGEAPPEDMEPAKVVRNILAEKPRVTRFPVDWT
uniref:Anti-silencing function protein 1 n=1 Tax=Bicosoecida sp. CB-2014 TaxID=1486930 RepID=A0A7S1C5P9_9STRA|mmetsp:Transcript_14506/g.50499  ORF Transcript_14506/g.50499 Transcript_14506/m.50499 type:complete len:156 (+) Transcript_14506:393-860(+)